MTAPWHLLADFGLSPRKSLGQNFLHDPNILARIVESATLPPDATVLEVGPGTGALTQRLARVAQRVVAIDADERLRPLLEAQVAAYDNVELHWGDFLKADVESLMGEGEYYVVANLPYYITSAVVRKLLEAPHRPCRLVLTVQKEVAHRMLAEPGNMGLLAISVQFYGHPQLVTHVKPTVFWPRPGVESAVLRIDVYDKPVINVPDAVTFFKLVRAGFGQKRKQLKNALANGLGMQVGVAQHLLESAGRDPRRRAETLSRDEGARLSHQYAAIGQ